MGRDEVECGRCLRWADDGQGMSAADTEDFQATTGESIRVSEYLLRPAHLIKASVVRSVERAVAARNVGLICGESTSAT